MTLYDSPFHFAVEAAGLLLMCLTRASSRNSAHIEQG